MRRQGLGWFICTIFQGMILVSSALGQTVDKTNTHKLEIISAPLTIDRIYRAMEGPKDARSVSFPARNAASNDKNDLIWLTGMKTDVFDVENNSNRLQEHLCHVTLTLNEKTVENRHALFDSMKRQRVRLMSLFQGQTELHFPPNFAIPILSTESLFLGARVLNNNEIPKEPYHLKLKNTIEYVYDEELTHKMNPLFLRLYVVQVPVTGMASSSHCDSGEEEERLEGPSEEKTAEVANGSWKRLEKDKNGNVYSYHWMVPPGRHIYHYRLQEGLEISYDTTAHYINVHLHPFGQYVELRDLTTGKTVFKGRAKNFKNNRRGITYSESYSSEKGILLHKDHNYEIVCEYNNTTSEDVDAMAKMFVFYLDKTFDKEQLRR